jgi:hypothetical protein
MSAEINNGTADKTSYFSYAISGATTSSADDSRAGYDRKNGTGNSLISVCKLDSSLTAGSNTFTMKYRSDTPGPYTATFARRRIMVMAL